MFLKDMEPFMKWCAELAPLSWRRSSPASSSHPTANAPRPPPYPPHPHAGYRLDEAEEDESDEE